MQNHRFGTHGSEEPSYYVFNHRDDGPRRPESAFYHYDTPQEAIGLFQYLLVEHPDWHLTLGVHKDYTRRADVIEHVSGATILVDDFKRTSPWKDDLSVSAAAIEAAQRLGVEWQVDRELADAPILVPYESPRAELNPFFENKSLRPDEPGKPFSSISEVCLEGEGWIPFEQLKNLARRCWFDMGSRPKVTTLLVSYQANPTGFGASASVTPAEFEILRQRYEAEWGRAELESLDEVKLLARQHFMERNAVRRDVTTDQISRGETHVR